jgi:steroid 5-alpha reductase family enzyme
MQFLSSFAASISAAGAAGIVLLALIVIFSAAWARQRVTQNAGMIDPIWSYSVGVSAVFYALVADGAGLNRILVAVAGGVWGVRLGSHLWKRNAGHEEDGRYRRLRDEWGPSANLRMFWFFQIQVVIALLLSLGFLVVAYRADTAPPLLVGLAVLVWIASIAGEAQSDRQLHAFKADPANHGKVCRTGLWRYSRHPNYFFECLQWLTYVLLAVGSPWIWFTLIPPVVMAVLLMKLSGIPVTEAQTARSRPDYAEYMRTTSALIPWPPKRTRSNS